MSESDSLIPVTDEQAKAFQEALKTLQAIGGFLKQTIGTVPEDLVGVLGGDWLRVRRAENIVRMVEKMKERLKARHANPEQPSISVALPLLIAAADEDRGELQEIWARLLAAAADPKRAKAFRIRFIEVAKKMDPLDAAVLQRMQEVHRGGITGQIRNDIAAALKNSRDEVDVSVDNLENLGLVGIPAPPDGMITPFGREFLRSISD